ncbi:uncharacterized protein J3D65DRAFT_198098 [Phyllosticta citribraziliensis]|uniref:Uncharacterized protein n=1 Tax=Phyllosticta citribraziliensis TaxID=989973 RepID=A0ABR1M387_9PEZI
MPINLWFGRRELNEVLDQVDLASPPNTKTLLRPIKSNQHYFNFSTSTISRPGRWRRHDMLRMPPRGFRCAIASQRAIKTRPWRTAHARNGKPSRATGRPHSVTTGVYLQTSGCLTRFLPIRRIMPRLRIDLSSQPCKKSLQLYYRFRRSLSVFSLICHSKTAIDPGAIAEWIIPLTWYQVELLNPASGALFPEISPTSVQVGQYEQRQAGALSPRCWCDQDRLQELPLVVFRVAKGRLHAGEERLLTTT